MVRKTPPAKTAAQSRAAASRATPSKASADYRLALFSPSDVTNPKEGAIQRWNDYPVKFLAQGDSWFSLGALPPWATSSLLEQMVYGFSASAVNCAYPGRRLAQMAEWGKDSGFNGLLTGKFAYRWDGILLSGGGNDLIAAAGNLPTDNTGKPVPPRSRLLLNPDEWGPVSQGAGRYLSEPGWKAFAANLRTQFYAVVALRDQDINRGVPLFCHSYAYPLPRNAPASELFHVGPWLYPAVVAYHIPEADWFGVAVALINRLADLLTEIIGNLNQDPQKAIHLILTHADHLTPAQPGSTGPSGDWENEIHPTSGGYAKLAALWRPVVEAVIPGK